MNLAVPLTATPPVEGPGLAAEALDALVVSALVKAYGVRRAVDGVSFTAGRGITGLLGPNGAGKSTLFRCVAGLSGWDEGTVTVDGVDLSRHPAEARRHIGFMPERVSFPNEMRVAEYLRWVAQMKGVARRDRPAMVDAALEWAGLGQAAARIIGNLSKGYRQRVGLAQALLGDAPVVLLDEPSAGLDPLSVMEFREVLSRCGAERTIMVSTHLLSEARLMCDRVIVMSEGRIAYQGPTSAMVGAAGQGSRARVRAQLAGSAGAPDVSVPGVTVVSCTGGGGDYSLIVDTEGMSALGALVTSLVGQGWSVVAVEPTTDALEESFRSAVRGAGL